MTGISNKRIITGGIFLVIGSVLLLDNLHLFNIRIPWYFFTWQMFLILFGVFIIAAREKLGVGLTLITIGGVFLIAEINYWNFWDVFNLWPVIFILIGISPDLPEK